MQRRLTPSWQLTLPLAASLLGFISAHITQNDFVLVFVALGFLFGIGSYFKKSELAPLLCTCAAALLLFWLSVWRVSVAVPAYDSVAYLPQEEIALEGRVVDYQTKEEVTQLVLRDIVYGKESRTDGVLLTIQGPMANWQVGDHLRVACDASVPEVVEYRDYLASRNIYLTCMTSQEPLHLGRSITPGALAWKMRESFITRVNARFAEPYATLLTGLYIGDVSFSKQYQAIFKATGVTHIVAASGYNVSVTGLLLFAALAALGVKRQDAFWWLVIGIIAFVIVAGASAPVVRAGIMGIVVLFGKSMGRKASIRNVLLLTVIAMLFVQPLWLFSDIGFQLSVMSTLGLVYLSDFFSKLFRFVPETLGLREAMSTTCAATLATLPILILTFEQVSVIAPVANLLVLPALPYVLVTGALALLAPASPFLVALPWLGLEWMLRITESLASLSFALVPIPHGIVSITLCVFIATLCLLLAMSQNGALPFLSRPSSHS